MSDKKKLTLTNGAPVGENQNVLTAGPRGPMLLQDLWFLEKLAHTSIVRSSPSAEGTALFTATDARHLH